MILSKTKNKVGEARMKFSDLHNHISKPLRLFWEPATQEDCWSPPYVHYI